MRRALPVLIVWEAAVMAALPYGQFTLGLAVGGLVMWIGYGISTRRWRRRTH